MTSLRQAVRPSRLPDGVSAEQFELAWEVLVELASGIGPRRPTGQGERRAAELVRRRFEELGVRTRLEPIRGVPTFAWAQAAPLALAVLRPGLPALALALAEGDLRVHALTRAFSRRQSANVVAQVEPQGAVERTVCLVSHLDSSRSGLLFHPRLAPHLRRLLDASALALLVQAGARFLRRSPLGWLALVAARCYAAFGLGLLLERELRGRDVPGANDNASGVGAAVAIAAGLAARPLKRTRVVFLATGCEESGTIGARSFLERHATREWLFLNLDGVAAPATLRYLPREGVVRVYRADTGLLRACERVARERPELGLRPAERLVGLTYDATPVLARGGRAITLSAQDETIPNYHVPEDVPERCDPDTLARALGATRALLEAIDAGAADA